MPVLKTVGCSPKIVWRTRQWRSRIRGGDLKEKEIETIKMRGEVATPNETMADAVITTDMMMIMMMTNIARRGETHERTMWRNEPKSLTPRSCDNLGKNEDLARPKRKQDYGRIEKKTKVKSKGTTERLWNLRLHEISRNLNIIDVNDRDRKLKSKGREDRHAKNMKPGSNVHKGNFKSWSISEIFPILIIGVKKNMPRKHRSQEKIDNQKKPLKHPNNRRNTKRKKSKRCTMILISENSGKCKLDEKPNRRGSPVNKRKPP